MPTIDVWQDVHDTLHRLLDRLREDERQSKARGGSGYHERIPLPTTEREPSRRPSFGGRTIDPGEVLIDRHVKCGGEKCPVCGSFEVEYDGHEEIIYHEGGGDLFQPGTCTDCGSRWVDAYSMVLDGLLSVDIGGR